MRQTSGAYGPAGAAANGPVARVAAAGYRRRVRLRSEEARRRFAASRSAVLGTADADGRPHLVPVTFAVVRDDVLIAIDDKPKQTFDLRRLQNIAANPATSLLADRYDDDWTQLWWARADGAARIVAEPDALPPGLLIELRGRYASYADNAPAGPFIVVAVERWSGWAFAA